MNPVNELYRYLLDLSGGTHLGAALVAGVFAAIMTSIGGLIAVIPGVPKDRRQLDLLVDVGLSFSSGVMIVASFTSLLLPSIESYGFSETLAGFLLGALSIHVANKIIPHEHLIKGYEGPQRIAEKIRTAWLVAVAILIHNLPEGLSIGAASAYSASDGLILGIAIGLQDFPEGSAVAIPILAATGSRLLAAGVASLSGFSEVAMALVAVLAGEASVAALPYLMGFGAGAMVYVVSHEALPESHRAGHEGFATLGFFAGFIVMLALDTMLG